MNLTFLGCGGEIVKYNIKTVRTLVTDNKKSFRVGEDIAFTLFNKVTNHHDHYIGNIIEMTDTSIKISNIEIDRCHEDGEMIIDLENIESNSCNYVYCDQNGEYIVGGEKLQNTILKEKKMLLRQNI